MGEAFGTLGDFRLQGPQPGDVAQDILADVVLNFVGQLAYRLNGGG
jgi:hypothetical protein